MGSEMKKLTNYLLTNIETKTWRTFKANVLLNGHKNVAECLRDFISSYTKGSNK